MNHRLLRLAAVLSFVGVALGALGAHALKQFVEPLADGAQRLAWWETASRYHLFHALGVGLLAVAALPARRAAWVAGWLTAGVCLFSGSLYVMALSGFRVLGAITPLGGVAFLIGWFTFAWSVRATPAD